VSSYYTSRVPLGRAIVALLCLDLFASASYVRARQEFEAVASPLEVRSLLQTGRYAAAETAAASLVSQLQEKSNGGDLERAHAIDLLVEALVLNGNGAGTRTRALAEQAVDVKASLLGVTNSSLADSLRNLGDVFVELGEYPPAIARYQRALAIRETVLGPTAPEVAEDLDRLARVQTLAGQYDVAATINSRALSIKEASLVATDVRLASTLEASATLRERKGDYAGARALVQRALEIREAVNPAHPAVATSLNLLAQFLWLEGDLVQARQVSTRAVSLAEAGLRPGHPDIASCLIRLAMSVNDLGDLSAARTLRERALRIAEQAFGSDHPAVAVQLNDLAISLLLMGEYTDARTLYERAVILYERRFGRNDLNTVNVVYNLGVASGELKDYADAHKYYDRAISAWESVLNPNHAVVARGLAGKAQLFAEQGLNSDAKSLFERALAIREQALGKNHRDVARTLMLLAMTEAKLHHLGRALELSARAVGILEQSNERETRRAADAMVVHGTLLAANSDYAAARGIYEKALVIRGRIVGPSHPDVAAVRVREAEAFANERQPGDALENALEAEEISRAHQRLTLRSLPERQALGFAAKRPEGMDLALMLAESGAAAPGKVLDRLIRSRALVLDEMAARQRDAAGARSEVASLTTALNTARQRLANLVVRGPGQHSAQQYLALVEEARREKERAEAVLAEKSAPFRAELARRDVGLQQVSQALPSDSAMLSLVRYERLVLSPPSSSASGGPTPAVYPVPTKPSYLAFVLRGDGSQPAAVALGDAAAIDDLVKQWRSEIMAGLARTPASPRTAERALRALGARLRQRVWDPVKPAIGDAAMVFVVPDGSLNLLPLAALPVGANGYLVENGPKLHYLSAERDLVATPDSSPSGHGLLAIGGAAFDDPTLFAALTRPGSSRPGAHGGTNTTNGAGQSVLRGAASNCLSLQTLRFPPLPATGREAATVAALWREVAGDTSDGLGDSQTLAGRDANERTLKQRGPGHRVLHLATHGFFLGNDCQPALAGTRSVGGLTTIRKRPSTTQKPAASPARIENPLLLSGLAMSGANRRMAAGPDEDDGILTAEEVASLNLEGVEWAVLSACDTGLGEIKAGEGVFGLRRAFQIAGARTVIMSLWSVEDRSAMAWMKALYEGRLQRNLDTADAVREASLTVLRRRRARGQSTHPFFWAGFVASGHWR
jgi:CHAT domain-containing protein